MNLRGFLILKIVSKFYLIGGIVLIQLEIGDFLGFCDLNGVEAIQSEQVQKLEEYITACNDAHNDGRDLVSDAIYDRLMEILRTVSPDSELCKYIWEDSVDELDDTDSLIRNNPMYSIQTIKSFDCDEIKDYVKRLPDENFTAHISVKLNGHGIRLKYRNGEFYQARSRARASAGRDLTSQIRTILERDGLTELNDISGLDICEIRGEWVLPLGLLDEARKYNPNIVSAFTAVSSLGRDSASEEEWNMLHFVAYELVADGIVFDSKDEEYSYLEDLGFETPLYWLYEDMNKATLIDELKTYVQSCEEEVTYEGQEYDYYTDGLVFTINDTSLFRSLGDDGGHYKFGNMALKVGYWQQDMYHGYIQTILWMKGKTKITPVAIVAEEEDIAEFIDDEEHEYVMSQKQITNYSDLGVVTASGNRVRRVPLYEPSNMLVLDAFRGNILNFRYGGEAGVVPCFDDGTPLSDSKIKNMLQDDLYYED